MAMGQWSLLGTLVLFFWGAKGASEVLFVCSFATGMCRTEMGQAREIWKWEYLTGGRREGPAMVVRGNYANNHLARLMIRHVASRGARAACMRFSYRIQGLTYASLSVIKVGMSTKNIFRTGRNTGPEWQRAHVDFQFLGDEARFYFEADTRVQDYGTSLVAIRDLIITKGACRPRGGVPNRRRLG